jgi:hypothetical protein
MPSNMHECEFKQPSTSVVSSQQPSPEANDRSDDAFANTERIPGAELHPAVYRSIAAVYIAALFAAWIGFAFTERIDLDLTIVTLLFTIFLAVPVIMVAVASARWQPWRRQRLEEFLSSTVDTATGPLPASEAWLQILLIPLSVAAAAALIGAVHMLVASHWLAPLATIGAA